jgi:hypothetical protein
VNLKSDPFNRFRFLLTLAPLLFPNHFAMPLDVSDSIGTLA